MMDIIKLKSESFFKKKSIKKCDSLDRSGPIILSDWDEDAAPSWRNHAGDFHSSVVGEAVYEDMLARQFQEAKIQSSGFFGDISHKIKKTKADLFRAQRLIYPGYDCSPRPVGGAGYAKVVSNPFFPQHELFRQGRIFSIRLRHNNLTFSDDAMLDGRVTCVKFLDAETGGDLDLILYTGRVPPYYNAASFQEYVQAVSEGDKGLKTWILERPASFHGRVESVRRHPQSFQDQHYYCHVTYEMTSLDGSRWLTRLRLVPSDGQSETGLPDKGDQENAWRVDRWSGDRDKNYLRHEFKSRLRKSPLQYRLQIQMRNCDLTDPQVLNACVEWPDNRFKWHDLATMTVTHPLHQQILAKTHFDILANPPLCFKPVEPRSMKDFCSLALVIREFHGVTANSQSEGKEDLLEKEDTTELTLIVKTGNFLHAGTDADVYITFIGERDRTEWTYLDTPFHDDFEAGCTDTFNLTIASVGQIVAVQLELRSILSTRQWYLEYVKLEFEEDRVKTTLFPCYQWLSSSQPSILLRSAIGICYYEETTMYGLFQRKFEIERRKQQYLWENIPGLPGRIACAKYDSLPRGAKFRVEKERDLMEKYLRTLANSGVSAVTTLFEQDWNIFTDYDKLLNNVLKEKKVVRKVGEIWKDDKEFGRQMLNGPHPSQIRRVTEVPDDIQTLNALVGDSMDRGRPLALEIQNGYVYMLDYPELGELDQCRNYKGKYDRYITSPECYLYSNKNGELVPIFIRIPSPEDNKSMLFTPKDSPEDWLLAKMWVREADAQIHQVVSRHLKTQLAIEVFAMATMRNLPSVHPVFKLLLPHLRYTIGLNVLGRQSLYPSNDGLFQKLLAVGGQHMDLLKVAYSNFDISDLRLPSTLETKGVDDPEKLPNYFYRDDGLKLWNAINKFVRTVIYLHYWSHENVRADSELQEWLQDLLQHGFPMSDTDKTISHGLPESLHSIDILVEIVTTIIFTATCRNAAITLGMMDYYSFVPNIPTMLLQPPPSEKGVVTMDTIKKMLPSRGKSAEIIAACYTLSRFGRDEIFLGDFPEEYFEDDTIKACYTAFSEDLDRIAAEIRHRNSELDIPYTYLLPGTIPNSVSM